MFGTIGHATVKPGQKAQLEALMEDWKRKIRPTIPGSVCEVIGHRAGQPDQIVFLVLMQDEATYRNLADKPEQHQFYLRLTETLTSEPTWEDVEMEWAIRD